ncbi:MAG TPA: hypothetical protein VJ935_10615 [Acidimicrobiia bacterium]|nr:hypothetical protein [Acidimicrobiia bacterium]
MSKESPYEDLRSLGDHLRSGVPLELSAEVAAAAVRRHRPRRSRTWLAVVVTGGFFALSNVALAQVSDSAVPGEFLYPLDRAYEWIGGRFGPQDLAPERISEAIQLVESGDTDRALVLVNEILGEGVFDPSLEESVTQLQGSGNSQVVRDEVKDLVGAAAKVHEAAQAGNHSALNEAIEDVKAKAADVAETAGNPSVTTPGQVDAPIGDNPSVTAPGQIDSGSEDSPSATAPGGGNNRSQGGEQGSRRP